MIKWIIALVVIVAAAGGLWWSGWLNNLGSMFNMTPATTQQQATTTQQAATQPAAPNDLPTATNDASDAALAQDAASIDAQMQNYNTDSANVSSSLNDKPVSQEY